MDTLFWHRSLWVAQEFCLEKIARLAGVTAGQVIDTIIPQLKSQEKNKGRCLTILTIYRNRFPEASQGQHWYVGSNCGKRSTKIQKRNASVFDENIPLWGKRLKVLTRRQDRTKLLHICEEIFHLIFVYNHLFVRIFTRNGVFYRFYHFYMVFTRTCIGCTLGNTGVFRNFLCHNFSKIERWNTSLKEAIWIILFRGGWYTYAE